MLGDRIEIARRARELTQRELADRIGVSAMAISKMENGELAVSDAIGSKIASETGFPSNFFERPVRELPPPLYRKQSAMGQKRLDAIQALASIYVESHEAITKAAGANLPLKLPHGRRDDIEAAASETRRRLGLALDEPVNHVLREIEQAGCVVIQLPSFEARFDGFSTWCSGVPVIVTDSGIEGVGDRQRFTAAHELGHLVLHRNTVIDLKQAEDDAHAFAGAFLLPKRAILEDLKATSLTPHGLAPLKAKWRVAISALFMRAVRLGLVDDSRKTAFFKDMSRKGWRKREPIDVPLERPIVLRKALEALRKKQPKTFAAVAPVRLQELLHLVGLKLT